MRSLRKLAYFGAAALCLVANGSHQARAEIIANFAFGSSTFDGHENLLLLTSDGGHYVISTEGHEGWWSPTLDNTPSNFQKTDGNSNYFAGVLNAFVDPSGDLHNNFFSFDVSGLRGKSVVTALLAVTAFETRSGTGEEAQNYSLWNVSTDFAALNDASDLHTTSTSIFDDLGSGHDYGYYSLPVDNFLVSSDLDVFVLNTGAIMANTFP